VHEGILKKVFNYDYAPVSVELPIGRIFLNLSQEGIDMVEDLREFGFIDCLKLSSTSHLFLNAYKVNSEGIKILEGRNPNCKIIEGTKKIIDNLCTCPKCGQLKAVDIEFLETTGDVRIDITCMNKKCDFTQASAILDVEDVSYVAEPYLPKFEPGEQ
jgi:hypothetical protein